MRCTRTSHSAGSSLQKKLHHRVAQRRILAMVHVLLRQLRQALRNRHKRNLRHILPKAQRHVAIKSLAQDMRRRMPKSLSVPLDPPTASTRVLTLRAVTETTCFKRRRMRRNRHSAPQTPAHSRKENPVSPALRAPGNISPSTPITLIVHPRGDDKLSGNYLNGGRLYGKDAVLACSQYTLIGHQHRRIPSPSRARRSQPSQGQRQPGIHQKHRA